jgi:hypothetical protein
MRRRFNRRRGWLAQSRGAPDHQIVDLDPTQGHPADRQPADGHRADGQCSDRQSAQSQGSEQDAANQQATRCRPRLMGGAPLEKIILQILGGAAS